MGGEMKSLIKTDIENLLTAIEPGGIERSEARGQSTFCREADRLPCQILHGSNWVEIEKRWGIKPGEIVDKIFYSVNLPEGWKVVPTDHSMWSKLVDGEGAERAAIFFKAAFYDFNAHMSLIPRYGLKFEGGDDHKCRQVVVDGKTGRELFTGPWSDFSGSYVEPNRWLKENYPDHEDPYAYWE